MRSPPVDVLVRPVLEDDWRGLLEVETSAFGDEGYDPYFVRMIPRLFARTCFVAARGGRLVGYALGAREDGDPRDGWALSLAVRRDEAGQGIGTELARACIEGLRAVGVERVWLTVDPTHAREIALYRGLGFEEDRVVAEFYGPGRDRLLMRLDPR